MQGSRRLTCCSACCLNAAVILLAALPWMQGGCRTACVRSLSPEAYVDLPAALPRMRGGCRTSCDVEARRPQSLYLPPCRGCEAAVAPPATWMPRGRSRLTCCLVVNVRQLSTYLPPPRGYEAAVGKLAALTIIGGVYRPTCRLTKDDARRLSLKLRPRRSGLQSSYLLSRPGCKAAIDTPATFTSRCRSRPTCRLVVDARRLSTYLPAYLPAVCRPEDEADLPAASLWMRGGSLLTCELDAEVVLPAASPWMRGGCRTICDLEAWRSRLTCRLAVDARRLSHYLRLLSLAKSSYLLPRRGCEAAVAFLRPAARSRSTCRLVVDARRLSPSCDLDAGGRSRPTCRLAADARRLSHHLRP